MSVSITVASPNGRRAHEVDAGGAIAALEQLGLRVIGKADQRVLDAMATCSSGELSFMRHQQHGLRTSAEAELARREEKP